VLSPIDAITISSSVGFAATNHRSDVLAIQRGLNHVPASRGGPDIRLQEDGIAGPLTKRCIVHFQQTQFHWADGRIDPRGPTLRALNHAVSPTAPAVGVRPLSRAEIRSERTVPTIAEPAARASSASVGWVLLQSGECWLRHGEGRTPLVAGRRYAIAVGDRVIAEDGTCKLLYHDGTIVAVRPNTLIVVRGASHDRVRSEGSRAVMRPDSLTGRLRELSGG
jgi:peptidoglycan hydrolase-like protein with peptidoglycan-binding domain